MDYCNLCTISDGHQFHLESYVEGALGNFTREKLTICQAIKAAKEEAGQC